MNKVIIIGCGNVGMSYAYALLNQRTNVNELVLIDLNEERTIGEVMDLNHCLAFAPSKIDIKYGSYEDCRDADIICIAAGAKQEKGETRMDLIHKNSKIFKEIVDNIMRHDFKGIFLIATNPLDVMTYLTWKYSKINVKKVIGSGTSLDTSRLRYLIGEELQINPKNIHAYVIGEHGDSEFVPWNDAMVGLQNMKDYLPKDKLDEIYHQVKNSAYEIIARKGATYYGIGMCLARITNAILSDENSILTVSAYDEEYDIFIGMPCIIGRDGIKEVMYLDLIKEEKERFESSAKTIKEAINSVI